MKKTALRKDVLREIKKSLGRFLSIFAIVAIGVAFFAGINESVPVMKGSADAYFDAYNFMDVKIMSSLGISKEDEQELKKINGVEGVYGGYSLDALTMQGNYQKVLKVMSFPMHASRDDPNYINQLRVVKGRMPIKDNECVIESGKIRASGYQLQDQITLTSGTDDPIKDILKQTTYTIVGEVTTPYYLSYEKGSASIGSGVIDNYIIISDQNFKYDFYTELYITVKNAKRYNAYDNAYFDVIDQVTANVSALGDERADLRFQDIKQQGLTELAAKQKSYKKNETQFQIETRNAKKDLENAHDEALIAQATLNANKLSSQMLLQQKQVELKQNKAMLISLQKQYKNMKTQLDKEKEQLDQKIKAIKQQIKDAQTEVKLLDKQIKDIEEQLKNPDLTPFERASLEARKQALEFAKQNAEPNLEQLYEQLASFQQIINKGMAKLQELSKQIDLAIQQIKAGEQELTTTEKKAQAQYIQAQKDIDAGNQSIEQGRQELEQKSKDGEANLKEAKEKLEKAQYDIEHMDTPKWYVLDRTSHYSYMDYGSAADRMGGIAKVFPVFFFLVAALVCLTTMTRMVDEQRQEIGTLKALGYAKCDIAMKYIMYAALASITGGIFGAITGMLIFPAIIYNAWNIMYTMPSVHLQINASLAVLSIAMVSSITIIAAFVAVYKELMDVPSQLMRPKAPKNGKKILLERLTPIWDHFNFTWKVTARNIFRYKKRFFMTVIGISGCSALLLAGYGIQDSIGDIVTLQYEVLHDYDVSMSFSPGASASQREAVINKLNQDDNVKETLEIGLYHGFYTDEGEDKGIDIYVPLQSDHFEDFITLRTRIKHTPISLLNDGAVITEKLAKEQGIAVGDVIAVDNGDGSKQDVKISDICENYIGHALYMSPAYYKNIFHVSAKGTQILGVMKQVDTQKEQMLGNAYMKLDSINSITFYSGIASSFKDTISSLSFIVIVLIVCAGILAFIVLYNLTNVNISERLREIATIKVLGFYDLEVSSYVYRENVILTLIGAFCGLALGILLHAMIMNLAEMDTVMFGRNIYPISFVYAILITMLFSIIVNLVMYRKLKLIPMVESLKSVE